MKDITKSQFYSNLNLVLCREFPILESRINNYLKDLNKNDIEAICQLGILRWGQSIQWRIEIDFDDYEWDIETFKPHYLGAFISIEYVRKEKTLHCNFGQFFNSFNSYSYEKNKYRKIECKDLDSLNSIKYMSHEVDVFIKYLHANFAKQIDEIDFSLLEKLHEQ